MKQIFLALTLLLWFTSLSSAEIVYETDYATKSNGDPFNPGELRFQDGWVGQTGYTVNPVLGTVTASGAFLRTLHNKGALGSFANSASDGTGPGFSVGDQIKITTSLQFQLSTAANQTLSSIGVRENYSTGAFDASPTSGGFKVAYSSFAEGSLKVFTNYARNGFTGSDNSFALFISAADGGFASGGGALPQDLSTDNLEFRYTGVYDGSNWVATALTVTNLDSATLVGTASGAQLESMSFSGLDAYYGQRFIDTAGPIATSSGMRFEFIATPEPTSLALFGMCGFVLYPRRRKLA